MSNEFVKLRCFEHPDTGDGLQFLVYKDYDEREQYPYLVVVRTENAQGTTGKCVLKYDTSEKQQESFETYFTEQEMLEFFEELVRAADSRNGLPRVKMDIPLGGEDEDS